MRNNKIKKVQKAILKFTVALVIRTYKKLISFISMYSKKNKKLPSDFRDDTLRANRFLNRDLFAWFAINR